MKEIRTDLTPQEKQKSYAKYFYEPIAEPNPNLIEILKKGPMDPAKALMPEDINKLLDPGYHEVETGYCILPNGAGYVAVNNKFPGVTVDMINWWFAWHALEDMRYMLWFRKGHFGIEISEEDRRIILDPNTPMVKKFQGRTHYVVEDTGGGVEDIQISFLSPEELGFDMDRFKPPAVGTVIAANGVSQPRAGGPKAPAIMLHFVREIPGGVEFRSRFWMGYHIIDKRPVKLIPDGISIPIQAPMGLAFHNVEEYSNLAVILPRLYKEMEGKIS
ncbi:hydrolase [Caloramator sp. E03]|uniref:DAPG hydrolase family protein n=1 Tax=Caloramator sp. E03 TaxID=2576307 RepID=UPI0011106230|nr:hydrolase [Caloramator sp. E03]QCX33301.1 hydrolase [Caloramator sp. E03]